MHNISLDDIKQLLETTIGQSEARIRTDMSTGFAAVRQELRQEMAEGLAAVRYEMAEGFASVGDAFSELNDRLDKNDRKVDQRLTRLESRLI